MTRDELFALPLGMQVRCLLTVLQDSSPEFCERLDRYQAPRAEYPPKYDTRIHRRDGHMWASECDVAGLRFWHERKVQAADSGGEWAEKDRKAADALGKFIAWREQNPGVAWQGIRGDEAVTAALPSGRPTVYPRAQRGERTPAERPQGTPGYDGTYGSGDEDDQIPF